MDILYILTISLGLYCTQALQITDVYLSVSQNLLHKAFLYTEVPDRSDHKAPNRSYIPNGLPILNV